MSYARRRYCADCINETSDNLWTLWRTVNNILHRTQSPSVPAFSDIKSLSVSFSKLFMGKIEKIIMNVTNDVLNMPDIQSTTVKSSMTCFEPATADEVRIIIINSPSKTCDLDPIPTESSWYVLLVPITQIVILSLISEVFPDISKTSHAMPLLKKPSSPKDDMKNYRPVSNLNFVSKIIEKKVIVNRIRSYLERNDL